MAKSFQLFKSSLSSNGDEKHQIMEPLLVDKLESVLQTSEKRPG